MKKFIQNYLNRISYSQETSPNVDTLKKLQEHHLFHVPFENLDIHNHKKLSLNKENLYTKIVEQRRGGFCYELNGLFFLLLKELGFNAKMISACVYNNTKKEYGPEFDHLAIIVNLPQGEYLVDVGFGDFTLHPLKLTLEEKVNDPFGDFIFEETHQGSFTLYKIEGTTKTPQYSFTKTARQLEEFEGMCHYHQTSPDSHFTQKRLISIPVKNGRITISGDVLIKTENGIVSKSTLENEEAFQDVLMQYFK
ncbi:arylamine N-acetyltransferase [Flammeovirga sp. SJP92]|uniref:arylamine N-acetyltransferase family protein n=1 Tax=Flammeovirga sp. SJP92 TaxID=1775430 RepID=UPI000788BC1F|nr:arylamine N-acetyltransferase [Flammeovirga sp. SJP92]KXX67843.1 hypothetical protein AVL50_25630 [Flammeovirga sp. SJP92]